MIAEALKSCVNWRQNIIKHSRLWTRFEWIHRTKNKESWSESDSSRASISCNWR